VQAETDDTTLDGDGESLRGPLAAAALGGLAGALLGAARVLASRHGDDEAETGEPEGREEQAPDDGAPSPGEAGPRDEPENGDEQEQEQEQEEEREQAAEPSAGSAAEGDEHEAEPEQRDDGASRAGGDLQRIVERATGQLSALTGRDAESVLAVERTDDGWLLRLEAVELERIPSSTDVLGAYEVELDRDGELQRYARVDRYVRSRGGDGGGS
jgi:Gas vesicle synthesis protein GvpO